MNVIKFCLECGDKFPYESNSRKPVLCGECGGESVKNHSLDLKSSSNAESKIKQLESQIAELKGTQPKMDQWVLKPEPLQEKIDLNSIQESFASDVSNLKNKNITPNYQSFKAEDIIASAPNENYEKVSRPGINLNYEKLIKSAAVSESIEI